MKGERGWLAVAVLTLVVSAATTIYWCKSMSGGMAMPGGWTMSMAWMKMPEQTLLGAFGAFMAMWVSMMVAMMMPSLVPMLSRYRRAAREPSGDDHVHPAGSGARRGLDRLTMLVAAGYFVVWAAVGVAVYPLGLAFAAAAMRWQSVARLVPIATGLVVVLAGLSQLSPWKRQMLQRCSDEPQCAASGSVERKHDWHLAGRSVRSAFRHGLRLGVHCVLCCSGFMVILLVVGVMDLRTMAILAAAITIERWLPRPERVVRAMGWFVVVAGAAGIANGTIG